MCGKFTALASWSDVVTFSQPLTESGGGEGQRGGEGSNDEIVTYRVGALLPVIVWDPDTHARRVVMMRWGFPDPRTGGGRGRSTRGRKRSTRRSRSAPPSMPVSAASSSSAPSTRAKRSPSRPAGRKPGNGRSTRKTASRAASLSCGGGSRLPICPHRFWRASWRPSRLTRSFAERSSPRRKIPACRRSWTTTPGQRGWAKTSATPAAAKAVLKTMEGVNWQAAPEPKKPRPRKP